LVSFESDIHLSIAYVVHCVDYLITTVPGHVRPLLWVNCTKSSW